MSFGLRLLATGRFRLLASSFWQIFTGSNILPGASSEKPEAKNTIT
jgi:hypothetical protein